MSNSTFYVSPAAIRNLKDIAARRLGGVSSSHLSEGVASALGFKTHAALRAAMSGKKTLEVSKPSNVGLAERLRALGYSNLPEDLRVLPELDRSYTPFRTLPLKQRPGVRWRAWRNLVVMAINAGLEQRAFGLEPGDDWWQITVTAKRGEGTGRYRFVCDGVPAAASVSSISGGELSLHVVLNPRSEDVEPEHFFGFRDGDASARCWLERHLGAWIQEGGEGFTCRRAVQDRLGALSVETLGYSDQGSFIM
jgi:hypothetical protein